MLNRRLLSWSRNLHVYVSVILLLAVVCFALTGITLNHAAALTGAPVNASRTLDHLPALPRDAEDRIALSPELDLFLRGEFGVRLDRASARYEEEFLLIDYQRPGAAILVEINQELEEAYVEHIDYGLIATLNDWRKGRPLSFLLPLLIDASAILLAIFALPGFVLLLPNKRWLHKVMTYSGLSIALLVALYAVGEMH